MLQAVMAINSVPPLFVDCDRSGNGKDQKMKTPTIRALATRVRYMVNLNGFHVWQSNRWARWTDDELRQLADWAEVDYSRGGNQLVFKPRG